MLRSCARKTSVNRETTASRSTVHIVWLDERAAAGKALRDKIPREEHGRWNEVPPRARLATDKAL